MTEPNNDKPLILFMGYGYTAKFISESVAKEGWRSLILPSRHNKKRAAFLRNIFRNLGFLETQSQKSASETTQKEIYFQDTAIQDNNSAPKPQQPDFLDKNEGISEFSLKNMPSDMDSFDYAGYVQKFLPQVTHIVVTAPPVGDKDPVLALHGHLFKDKIFSNLKWIGYLSSTSVYGDLKGEKCDETTEPSPTTERGKSRLNAENMWMDLYKELGLPVHIFRLSGIYGPERNPIAEIKQGFAISVIKEAHFSNRIYVKDIARALVASMKNPTAGEIFNLSDDMPASSAALNDYIAFMINVKAPPKILYKEAEAKMSEMRKSLFSECRIVGNDKIKSMLGFKFQYPTYREGIADIIKQNIGANDNTLH